MPQPQNMFGHFTSDGNPLILEIPMGISKFEIFNYTQANSTANPGVLKRALWQEGMPAGSYYGVVNTDLAATDETLVATTNGFTLIDTQNTNQLEAAVTGTALTAANPAVATATAHGYSVGDIVRVTQTTGMLQIAGMDFEITAVGGANNYTLGYLDASGFAAAATAIVSQRLRYQDIFAPRKRYITNITAAASAVVTFSVTHGYEVGEIIRLRVPAGFGMVEADGLQAEVTAVSTANNTVTLDLDTSAFTAFAFPASADATTFAHANPVGNDSAIVSTPFENTGFRGINLGSAVAGAASDVIYWEASFGY